ncbi:PREDICTED: NADH dehydrogenase [ubiquinone] 1 beta subcomplex subunit 8, mitochondrial-like [Branchiostoma belcheri]|uniref:NADH dehydrogenase [ubiquinone] 1 beta subcomplex subunit 8, mitochondrial-like n=1 Tax=Branchiostoma belcheri TaxID=7741 RepID=A0A6P5AEQ3_BRABE|nr:PREDICTED: NADH dehydrogenase [ubiquinone] 1 beta subcomplex subunit 8, mitochondrial-like [Branchiostoma belcheri]
MAAVGRLGSAAVRSFLWRRTALLSSARCLSKNELPGPYPQTPEEWAAAAKKYGMRVEDYQPYPDDGTGYGDYPMLPEEGVESKDPWVDWDDKWHRRNFGEAPHIHIDAFTRQRVNPNQKYVVPWKQMVAALLGFLGFNAVMLYFGEQYKHAIPVAPKQYPYNDLYLEKGGDPDKVSEEEIKHYEFPKS